MYMDRKIRKYFRKVKRQRMTMEEAAERAGRPLYRFRQEYEKYYDPFSKPSYGHWIFGGISVFGFFVGILPILIQYSDSLVNEKSYSIESEPELNIQEDIITLYWDDTGKLKYAGDTIIEDQFYQDSNSIIVPSLYIKNLGQVTARDIIYDWNYEENMENFEREFKEISIPMEAVVNEEEEVIITELWQNVPHHFPAENDETNFLDTENVDYISVPVVYLELLSRYCYEVFPETDNIDYSDFFEGDQLPQLDLTIEYTNILDEKNEDSLYIQFEPVQYKTLNGSAGGCTFQIKTRTNN